MNNHRNLARVHLVNREVEHYPGTVFGELGLGLSAVSVRVLVTGPAQRDQVRFFVVTALAAKLQVMDL